MGTLSRGDNQQIERRPVLSAGRDDNTLLVFSLSVSDHVIEDVRDLVLVEPPGVGLQARIMRYLTASACTVCHRFAEPCRGRGPGGGGGGGGGGEPARGSQPR